MGFIIRSLMLTILSKPCCCLHHCWQIRFYLAIHPQQQSLSRELCTEELLPTHIPVGPDTVILPYGVNF